MSKLTLSFKGKVLKLYPLVEGEMLIGSDPQCPIHIDSLAVQPRHAVLTTHGDATTLRDLGSPDGTFVGNERITERQLKNGDLIRIGKHNLSFDFEPQMVQPPKEEAVNLEQFTAQARHKTAYLQILSGHNLGKTLSLNRQLTNLGTPGIQTAVIARRNDGYFLSHLEGENPPRVCDTPIGDRSWPLQDGDIIQIGNVKMQFYYQ